MTEPSHKWWCWLLRLWKVPVLKWDTVEHHLYCKRCGRKS